MVSSLRIVSSSLAIASILALRVFDPILTVGKVIQKVVQQVTHGLGQIVAQIAKVPPDVGVEATGPNTHGQPIFDAKGAGLVHQPGALTHEPVPDAVKRLQVNLLRRAHFDKSHGWSGHGLGNGSRINRIGFVRFHVGLHKPGRDDPGIMPHNDQPPGQPLRARTGLHADQCFGCHIEEGVQRLTRKPGALDHGALSIDGNNVEYLFANVDPIGKGLRQEFGSHPFSPFA